MPSINISRVVIYPNELDRILKKPGGPVGIRVRRLCLDIAAEGERIGKAELGNRSPYDKRRTGNYVRRFRVNVETSARYGFEYTVSNNAKYAAVLEEGSKPHVIRARRVKYLRFRDRQGVWRRVRAVSHPGQRQGYHILWRATQTVVRKSLAPTV